jgi:hypothetical protein
MIREHVWYAAPVNFHRDPLVPHAFGWDIKVGDAFTTGDGLRTVPWTIHEMNVIVHVGQSERSWFAGHCEVYQADQYGAELNATKLRRLVKFCHDQGEAWKIFAPDDRPVLAVNQTIAMRFDGQLTANCPYSVLSYGSVEIHMRWSE